MNPIVFAIVVLVVLGLAGGVILVLASKFMAVYEDPRIAQITECLAGANCGGCGYAGCADYAKAIVENGAPTFKCAPGGDKTADAINTIMGNDTDDRPSLRATVICAGGENCGASTDAAVISGTSVPAQYHCGSPSIKPSYPPASHTASDRIVADTGHYTPTLHSQSPKDSDSVKNRHLLPDGSQKIH